MAMQEQPQDSASWRYVAPTAMDNEQFQDWVRLLEQRTGIDLPEARKTFLVTNLNIRMRELGMTDYRGYYDLIVSGSKGQVEWEVLVDRLTVHETRFFRDAAAMQFISETVLPGVLAKHAAPYTINVWSVGCATGEEPYSLAMLLDSYLHRRAENYYYGVTASDVSRAALQTARKALYHKHRIKNVPASLLQKYLQEVDADHVQVQQSLQQRICFVPINLLDLNQQRIGQMDLIVCQNVLIYFRQDRRQQIITDLVNHLKPGGIIILGPGELVGWTHPQLTAVSYQGIAALQRLPEQGT